VSIHLITILLNYHIISSRSIRIQRLVIYLYNIISINDDSYSLQAFHFQVIQIYRSSLIKLKLLYYLKERHKGFHFLQQSYSFLPDSTLTNRFSMNGKISQIEWTGFILFNNYLNNINSVSFCHTLYFRE